ncbi:MAG: ribonuclease P protein subunit [Thermoplasmata archaeon]|nr:ribonuclease P protein subunit [Thermoplasmata archaeon]
MSTPEHRAFLRQEFIGMDLMVKTSRHPDYLRMKGKVVDETKSTFRVSTISGVKMIPKAGNVFILNGKEVVGRRIVFRPENRIKKIR